MAYRTMICKGVPAVLRSPGWRMQMASEAMGYAMHGINLARADVATLLVRVHESLADEPMPYAGEYTRARSRRATVRIDVCLPSAPMWRAGAVGMGVSPWAMRRYGLRGRQLMLYGRREYLVFVLAHEARHLWQDRISERRWLRPEHDADRAGLRALMRWRADRQGLPGVGAWRPERRVMDQPAHLRKAV